MGWYTHPDTMSESSARHAAIEEVGNSDSLEFRKAFRRIYEERNRGDGFAGLDEYLAELDEEIEWLEKGKTLDDLNRHRRNQYFKRIGRLDLIEDES